MTPLHEPKKPDPLNPIPPQSLQKLEWLRRYGWKYKWHVLTVVVLIAGWVFIKRIVLSYWRTNKVTATVLAFNPENAELSLRLNNGTDHEVVLEQVYYTFFTTNREALKPVSIDLAKECPNPLIKVPEMGGFEIMHREVRQQSRVSAEPPLISLDWGAATNRWLVRLLESPLLAIDAGKPFLTNLVPYATGFRTACDVFVEDAPLELGVHFGLLGASAPEGVYEVDLPLGLFTRGENRSRFVPRTAFPVTVDLKQSDPRKWKHFEQSSFHVTGKQWVKLRPAEESTENGLYYFRVMTDSNAFFLCPGEIMTNRSTTSKVE